VNVKSLGQELAVVREGWRSSRVSRQVVAGVSKSNAGNWQETDSRR